MASEIFSRQRSKTLVTGLSSDSHTWNLIFLQLYLEERGHEVVNLGPCVPDGLLVSECLRTSPDLVLMSSVNGHGRSDGQRVVRKLREQEELEQTPIIIGGKLGISGRQSDLDLKGLIDSGFDAVFDDNAGSAGFATFLEEQEAQEQLA